MTEDDTNDENEISFLPFSALDRFMLDSFKREVVRAALGTIAQADARFQKTIALHTKRHVKIPGFRNSAKAPLSLQIKHLPETFGNDPKFVATIVQLWYNSKPELAQQVYDLLNENDWTVFPLDMDRTRLPGFLLRWPEDNDFDVLNALYTEKYPKTAATEDDVSLMVVWISGRLPIEMVTRDSLDHFDEPTENS